MSLLTEIQNRLASLERTVGLLGADSRVDTAHSRAVAPRSVTVINDDGSLDQVPGGTRTSGYVAATTTEKAVRHFLGATPAFVGFTPRSNVAVWESRKPDEDFIYVSAASAVTVRWYAEV